LVGGGALYGFSGDQLPQVMLGYLASWGRDLGLVSLALLCSTFVTSVGSTVVVVVLFLMADFGARMLLKLVGMMGMAGAATIGQFFPGAALDAWEQWSTGWTFEPFLGLFLLTAVALAGTIARLERLDVS
jgi:hypothetical protein